MPTTSDETYLESFIESLSSLPHEVKRNLDHLKDLDQSCAADLKTLRTLQKQFILQAERKMMKLKVVPMKIDQHGNDNENADVEMNDVVGSGKAAATAATALGVKVFEEDEDGIMKDPDEGPDDHVVIPTTEEFMDYIMMDEDGNISPEDKAMYRKILKLQQDCLQKSDEKVAVAQQTYEMIGAHVQRLDLDLAAMEKILQATGEIETGVPAQPDDLAACQVTAGSEWILAKVISYDPATGMYKLSDEDVESNKIFNLPESQVIILPGNPGRGEYKVSKGDSVFAIYPDTTSFYQSTVVQAPRKQNAANAQSQFVMVNFVDDADEYGITHDKAVPLKHIMPPPPS